MFSIFSCNHCKIVDSISVIGDQILKRVAVVLSDLFIGWGSIRHDWSLDLGMSM